MPRRLAVLLLGGCAVLVGCAVLGGCAAAQPRQVAGSPAPLTMAGTVPPGSGAAASSGSATGTAAGASATTQSGTRAPVLPTSFHNVTIAAPPATLTVPVPDGWERTDSGQYKVDFRDPTGNVLLRLQVALPGSATARAAAADQDRIARTQLSAYQLIGITTVGGIGDNAVDWKFSFVRDGLRRQVVDRRVYVSDADVAVYYSAPVRYYDAMKPVWVTATDGMRIG